MRLRHKPWAKTLLTSHPNYVPQNPKSLKGHWQNAFNQKSPLHLEVGSGKGRFITEMAKKHPEINYIAMELQTSIAATILQKQLDEQLPNLLILNENGQHLSDYFRNGEISRIYLNFSDPWPKKRHEKRRLTSSSFIDQYRSILIDNGDIHFKTDNQQLFEYSLSSMSQSGLSFRRVWLDLHNSDFEDNVETEYEEKFSRKGHPIYRLEAYFK